MCFGGASKAVQSQAPTTIQAAAPPPTSQSVEIQQQQRDVRKQAAKKKGLQSTILAGETGGMGAAPLGQQNQNKSSILGGV